MCVAISSQDVLDYIFSKDPGRAFLSYESLASFEKLFSKSIVEHRDSDPHYASVYISPLQEQPARRYDAFLDCESDGIHLCGKIPGDVADQIEKRYNDSTVSQALQTAYLAVSEEVGA